MRKKAYRALSRKLSEYLSIGGYDLLLNMDKGFFVSEASKFFKSYKGKYNSRYYAKKFNDLVEGFFNRFENNNETRGDIIRINASSIKLSINKEDNPEKVVIRLLRKDPPKKNKSDFVPISTPYWFYKDQLTDIKNLDKPIVIEINNKPETDYKNPALALIEYVSFRDSIFKEFDSSVRLDIDDMGDYFLFNFLQP